jgi:hypothetical protein
VTLWQNEHAIDVEMIEMTSPANFESRARLAPSGTRAVISAFDFAISLPRGVRSDYSTGDWPAKSLGLWNLFRIPVGLLHRAAFQFFRMSAFAF